MIERFVGFGFGFFCWCCWKWMEEWMESDLKRSWVMLNLGREWVRGKTTTSDKETEKLGTIDLILLSKSLKFLFIREEGKAIGRRFWREWVALSFLVRWRLLLVRRIWAEWWVFNFVRWWVCYLGRGVSFHAEHCILYNVDSVGRRRRIMGRISGGRIMGRVSHFSLSLSFFNFYSFCLTHIEG